MLSSAIRTLTIDNWRGVDFDSLAARVDLRRAAKGKNFCMEGGVLAKRPGWAQVTERLSGRVNGMWPVPARDGGAGQDLLVYAGCVLYLFDGETLEEVWHFTPPQVSASWPYAWRDTRAQAFCVGTRTYVMGMGDFVCYDAAEAGRGMVRRVAALPEVYTPRTTLGIRSEGNDRYRRVFEGVNMLSPWRKNGICGDGGEGENARPNDYTYKLDASVDEGTEVRVEATVRLYRNGEVVSWRAVCPDGTEVRAAGAEEYVAVARCFGEEGLTAMDGQVFRTEALHWSEISENTVADTSLIRRGGYWYAAEGYTLDRQTYDGLDRLADYTTDVTWDTIPTGLSEGWFVYETDGVLAVYNGALGTTPVFYVYPVPARVVPVPVSSWRIGRLDRARGWLTLGQGVFYADVFGDRADCLCAPVSGEDNITVTFRHTTEGHEEAICGSEFGILFGADGGADRLFFGRSDSHLVHYSRTDDPLYWPDNGYVAVGGSAHPVFGFLRVGEGLLAVFKEGRGAGGLGEPAVYYCQGQHHTEHDDVGNLTGYYDIFTVQAGRIDEVPISRYAPADLCGDPLLLSAHGVFGISARKGLLTTDRYAFERSRTIRRVLRRAAAEGRLSDAFGYVAGNRYYLCFGGDCYVADAHYTYTGGPGTDGGVQYEWWYLDHIPARVMCRLGDRLLFGTEDGRLCKVTPGTYLDEVFNDLPAGAVGFDIDFDGVAEPLPCTRLAASAQALSVVGRLREGDGVCLRGDVWEVAADGGHRDTEPPVVSENGIHDVLYFDWEAEGTPDPLRNLHEGDACYLTGHIRQGRYVVEHIDRGEGRVTVRWQGSADEFYAAPVGDGRITVLRNVRDELLVVEDVRPEAVGGSFALRRARAAPGEVMSFLPLEGESMLSSVPMRYFTRDAVVAEWYTPMMDLGSHVVSKTLDKLSVATEPGLGGVVRIGYHAGQRQALLAGAGQAAFHMEALDFSDFTLEVGAVSTTRRVNARNVNFVCLRMVSEDAHGCALYAITATYHDNRMIRGTR